MLPIFPHNLVTTRFPNIYQFCLDYGLDITKEMVPVAPAAHYMMGGVKVNTWGETNIPGLFAAGETACTGVHGANRSGFQFHAGSAGLQQENPGKNKRRQ